MQSARSEIEDAVDAVRQCVGQPWTFSRLPAQSSRPRLGTRGVDDWLTFPLTNAAQLLAEYPDGRIPLSHLYIENDEPDAVALADIMNAVDAALAPPSVYQAYLSHVVIDAVGSAAIMVPIDAPSGSFATLWVELPSSYEGGETTLTYDGAFVPTQQWPRHCDVAAAYNDVKIDVSPIVSGHRVLLVFSLAVDECATSVRTAPLSVNAAIDRLTSTVALPGATSRIWGYHLQHPVSALEWQQVRGADKLAAIALCASGVYDVALVEHAPYNDNYYDHDDDDDGAAPRAWSVRLAGGVLFPGTWADPSLADDLSNKTVAITPRARFSLAFWASSQRAHVAGHRVTGRAVYRFVTTQATWHAPDAYLGFPTGDALLRAWFETFGSRPFVDTIELERYLDTSSLCELLLQQRRLDLIECFLRDHCIYFKDCARDYASLIHSVLTIHGWEPLASTIDVLVTKWPLGGAMRLVASLAGVALDPVCPPLQRPFAKELIKTCFCRLIIATSTAAKSKFALLRHGTTGLQQLLIDVLLLQTYLMTPSESAHGSYLDAFLPAPLVHLVDTFVVPLSFIDAVVLSQRSIFDPIAVVGPAVLALYKHMPKATLAPLVAPLLASAQELPDDMTIDGLIAYLYLAPDLGMDLVTTIATRYPLLFVPAMLAVAKNHRDALDVEAMGATVIALSARLFDDEATTFVTEEAVRSSYLVQHYEASSSAWPGDMSTIEYCSMCLLEDATTFLDVNVPSLLRPFATAWTDALRGSAKRIVFFTHCAFQLLYIIKDVCARHMDVGVFLASTCRSELEAIAAQLGATLSPLPSVAMAADGMADDCASCANFATFLQDASGREYFGQTYATSGSPALCAHVRAIAVPAHGLRIADRQSIFGSVYIHKEPVGVDVDAWDALAKEHKILAGLSSRMRHLDAWIAEWTSQEGTAAAM